MPLPIPFAISGILLAPNNKVITATIINISVNPKFPNTFYSLKLLIMLRNQSAVKVYLIFSIFFGFLIYELILEAKT